MRIELTPQTIDGVRFRGRDYMDAEHLAAALERWADEAEAAGETDQAEAFRHVREIVASPLTEETIGTIDLLVVEEKPA